jgi:hypothetical protein
MVRGSLEGEGFAYYVDELRKSTIDPYAAYRVYERSWNVPAKDAALLRRATIRLIEADPWFLATAMPHFLHALKTDDLERLTPFVGAGPARKAAPLLRATLWYHGRRGPYHADRTGRTQLRKALLFLEQVPAKQRHQSWHEMLVGCYRVLDYAKYKRAVPRLLQLTPPNWRAAQLHDFLNVLAKKNDWKTYDQYRREWDQLPPGHHACECYLNAVHTDDGLRAAAAGKWEAVPASLDKAASVRGCPHLNSGGVRLDLVQLLVAKRKHLQPARKYLERAAAFEHGAEKVAKLRQRLDRIENGRATSKSTSRA